MLEDQEDQHQVDQLLQVDAKTIFNNSTINPVQVVQVEQVAHNLVDAKHTQHLHQHQLQLQLQLQQQQNAAQVMPPPLTPKPAKHLPRIILWAFTKKVNAKKAIS